MTKNKLTKEITILVTSIFRRNLSFSVLYGGLAFKEDFNYEGDIDLLVVTKKPPTKSQIDLMEKALISFSLNEGYELDDEVSYENKLAVEEKRLDQALKLKAFVDKKSGKFIIPLITEDNLEYLNTPEFLDRLFLNALTTVNRFVVGDQKRCSSYISRAYDSLLRLLYELKDGGEADFNQLFEQLFPPKNIWYKDYLGYLDCEAVRNHLEAGLKKAVQRKDG